MEGGRGGKENEHMCVNPIKTWETMQFAHCPLTHYEPIIMSPTHVQVPQLVALATRGFTGSGVKLF